MLTNSPTCRLAWADPTCSRRGASLTCCSSIRKVHADVHPDLVQIQQQATSSEVVLAPRTLPAAWCVELRWRSLPATTLARED